MKGIEKKYTEPWPLCWQLMQWDLLLWSSIAKKDTQINVTWNEVALQSQIKPADFRISVHEFREALKQQLGQRLIWHINTETPFAAHVINVCLSNTEMN